MSQDKLRDLCAEAINVDGTGDATFHGALRGHRTFAAAYAGALPLSGVRIKIEEANAQGYIVRWEDSECTVSEAGFTRDTCINSSNNGAFEEFGAGYKRAFVFIPVADVGGGSSGITPGTKSEYNTALTDGNFAFSGDAPTAHNQDWSTITSTPTTLAGYGITDGGGDTIPRWVRGVGMFQDYAGTNPVTAAGQYCRAWRADTGAMLVSQQATDDNVHVAVLFDGVLTPFSRPASTAYWATADAFLGNAYAWSMSVSHIQPGFGFSVCQPGATSGVTAWAFNDLGVSAPSLGLFNPTFVNRPFSANPSVIGYRATPSEQTAWVNGEELAPFPAPGTENAPVRIGILSDAVPLYSVGLFIHAFAIAPAISAENRIKITAEHMAYKQDLSARKGVFLAGDSTSSLVDSPPNPGVSLAYFLAQKYRLHQTNASGMGFSGGMTNCAAPEAEIARLRQGPVDAIIWNTNDYSSVGSGATVAAAISAFAAAKKASGMLANVYWCRTFTRTGSGAPASAAFEAEVDAAYAILSVDASIAGVIDLRSIDHGNIHPTTLGAFQAFTIIDALLS